MFKRSLIGIIAAAALATSAQAASTGSFTNGSFEDGNTNGWVIGGGSRSGQTTTALNPSDYLPGGARYTASIATTHSSVVTPGLTAFGALMPNAVYSGGYSLRVEDTTSGGYVSVASQTVNNYTDSNIFFAWLAVLENGGHSAEESAAMKIKLTDLTTNTVLINRIYNAVGSGGGVDSRFSQSGSFYYTPQWQIEQLAIDSSLSGHNFELTVLASDCAPTGHEGYIYLDGFGAVTPPSGGGTTPPPANQVPEPGALLLAATALLGAVATRRRRAA